jgi:hypothetical protein
VFKALFNRTRDWADIEDIAAVGTVDVDEVLGWVARLVGRDDPVLHRISRILSTEIA